MPELDTGAGDLLIDCAIDVLSTMCFTCAERVAEWEELPPCGEPLSGSVQFSGWALGEFAFCLPRELAVLLAYRFFGISEDEPLPEASDAALVGEISNIICGSWLSRLHPEKSFTLSSPKVASNCLDEEERWQFRQALLVEERPLRICMRID